MALPEDSWWAELCRRTASLAAHRWAGLVRYRSGLEPALHATAKEAGRGVLEIRGLEASAMRQLQEETLPPKTLASWLLREMQRGSPAMQRYAERVKANLALQDAAAAYWPCLSFALNLEFAQDCLDLEQQTQALAAVERWGHLADSLATSSLNALVQDASPELGQGASMLIALGKPVEWQRKLVWYAATSAAMEWSSVLLLVLLLVTVYRLPATMAEIQQRQHGASFTDRLRQAVAHQAWLLALDAWHLVTAVLASLLALVTLVRALDFLAEAALRATSLREVRILALRCAWDAIREIWELLSLFIVWRTYRCIVRAAVFGLLLPASCLVGIPPRLQMLSWVVLCSLPWTLPGTKPWMALALACLSLLPFFCCKAPALPQLQLEARWRLG